MSIFLLQRRTNIALGVLRQDRHWHWPRALKTMGLPAFDKDQQSI